MQTGADGNGILRLRSPHSFIRCIPFFSLTVSGFNAGNYSLGEVYEEIIRARQMISYSYSYRLLIGARDLGK